MANRPIFVMLMAAICGRGAILQAGMMPLLRFIVMALAAGTVAVLPGQRAYAEPLDRESCLKLQADRNKLLTREMKIALERGPDWVKDHLNTGEIEQVRQFLAVEEMIEFRCRGGGVTKQAATPPSGADAVPLPDRKPEPPQGTEVGSADTPQPAPAGPGSDIPPPDRKPGTAPPSVADVEPSQTLADSDKTAPAKAKATR